MHYNYQESNVILLLIMHSLLLPITKFKNNIKVGLCFLTIASLLDYVQLLRLAPMCATPWLQWKERPMVVSIIQRTIIGKEWWQRAMVEPLWAKMLMSGFSVDGIVDIDGHKLTK